VSKSESTASVSNARANGSLQTALGNSLIGKNQVQPALPSQNSTNQTNGVRVINGPGPAEPAAILALLPMNGTFERKQISLPFYPEVLRIGRQTNAKTVPTPVNGYFDSKVLSRQHAEVWADRNGKVWIRDVKSSNGTFVNGQRLSPENRESEPHELRQHDTLELGIDIVSEDQKTIVHHKVSAKVEYVGLPGATNNVLDLSFGDLDPSHGGSLLPSPVSSPMLHSRSRPGQPLPNGRMSAPSSVAPSQLSSVQQRQMNFWGPPPNVEQLVKSLSVSYLTFTSTDHASSNRI
jgi:pSer/pThr/pTyr-binding forkhead associated (FHA) protein